MTCFGKALAFPDFALAWLCFGGRAALCRQPHDRAAAGHATRENTLVQGLAIAVAFRKKERASPTPTLVERFVACCMGQHSEVSSQPAYSLNPDYLWSLKFERSAASSPATAISPTNMTALESVTAIASIDYDGALVRRIV